MVYALLPNKTTIAYKCFFTKLKEYYLENGLHLNPSVILSDFEGGIIRSIVLQFQVEIYKYWCIFLVHIDSITFFNFSVYNSHFPLRQFPLCQHWPNRNWQSGNWRSGNKPCLPVHQCLLFTLKNYIPSEASNDPFNVAKDNPMEALTKVKNRHFTQIVEWIDTYLKEFRVRWISIIYVMMFFQHFENWLCFLYLSHPYISHPCTHSNS